MRPNSGQVTGIISLVALSFMVQEPRGIMSSVNDKSLALQAIHVAEHFVLGVVGVENGVLEDFRFSIFDFRFFRPAVSVTRGGFVRPSDPVAFKSPD